MPYWYKALNIPIDTVKDVEAILNQYGKDGWKLAEGSIVHGITDKGTHTPVAFTGILEKFLVD